MANEKKNKINERVDIPLPKIFKHVVCLSIEAAIKRTIHQIDCSDPWELRFTTAQASLNPPAI